MTVLTSSSPPSPTTSSINLQLHKIWPCFFLSSSLSLQVFSPFDSLDWGLTPMRATAFYSNEGLVPPSGSWLALGCLPAIKNINVTQMPFLQYSPFTWISVKALNAHHTILIRSLTRPWHKYGGLDWDWACLSYKWLQFSFTLMKTAKLTYFLFCFSSRKSFKEKKSFKFFF